MRAKFVNESLEEKSSKDMLIDIIRNSVRTRAKQAKLIDYVERVYNFDPENPAIDKKEITRITNEIDGSVLRSYYGGREKWDEYKIAFNELCKELGYPDSYDATKSNEDLRAIQFNSVYGLSDAVHKSRAIEAQTDPKMIAFSKKYFPNIEVFADFTKKLSEIQKIVAPSAKEKREQELKIIKGSVNPEIKTAIDEIAEDFRKVIEEKEYNNYIRIAEMFKEKFPNGISSKEYYDRRNSFYSNVIGFLFKKKDPNSYIEQTHILIDNYEQKARQIAKRVSEDTIAQWQGKMYNKLGGFISELNKKFTTNVIGRTMGEHDIIFKFEDGSRFSIRNQIVSKISNKGTYFYAYPTTFHNAFLPDGSRIAQPSEFTVKDAFNKYGK